MKVVIDRDLCQGHALCFRTAPEVFELDDDGFGWLKSEDVEDGRRAEVEVAVRNCPEGAIRIED
jgi:ferredoxin